MFVLLLLNFSMILFTFYLSSHSRFMEYKNAALNPVVFYSFLNIFFVFDFYFFFHNPEIRFFETSFVVLESDVLKGFLIYTFFNFVFLFILCVGLLLPSFNNSFSHYKFDSKTASLSFFASVIFCFLLFFVNFSTYIQMFSGQVSRQILFSSNPLYHIAFSIVLPLFAIYASSVDSNKRKLLFAYFLTILVVFISGSRGNIIFATIVLFFSGFPSIRRMPSYFLFFSVPLAAVFLLISRFYLREQWFYSSINDFISDKGGLGQVFFNSTEISMAESIVTINLWADQLDRYPFESFIAGLMYPFPRSIFEFKPLGSGGVVTELLSPGRWDLTRSEIVTTGYGDLLMQFGIVGGLIVYSIIVLFWVLSLLKVIKSNFQFRVFMLPFLIWWPYIFLRADIFNMLGHVWTLFLALFVYYFVHIARKIRIRI